MKIVSEDLNFKGKRVLITGAASGIGAAMAETFSDHGASLILADINKMDPNYNKKESRASYKLLNLTRLTHDP